MNNLQDVVYEHDYADQVKQIREMSHTEVGEQAWNYAVDEGVMKSIGERLRALPHIIIPRNKEIFVKCEKMLDRMAFHRGGYIKSVISYDSFDAYIYLELPFFEFYGESMETLRYISDNVRSVTITPSKNNHIRIWVRVNYFEDIGDKDAIIDEEVGSHPELVDMLVRKREEEKALIMNTPELYAMIEKGAEGTGMTPEEWYDYMEAMIEKHPEILDEFIEESLRKKRERIKSEGESKPIENNSN